MLLRTVQIIKRPITATPINRVFCMPNPQYKVNPVQIVSKRNASIHTRNILIQKIRLEHVNNFGVLLLVRCKPIFAFSQFYYNTEFLSVISSNNIRLRSMANQAKNLERAIDCRIEKQNE